MCILQWIGGNVGRRHKFSTIGYSTPGFLAEEKTESNQGFVERKLYLPTKQGAIREDHRYVQAGL